MCAVWLNSFCTNDFTIPYNSLHRFLLFPWLGVEICLTSQFEFICTTLFIQTHNSCLARNQRRVSMSFHRMGRDSESETFTSLIGLVLSCTQRTQKNHRSPPRRCPPAGVEAPIVHHDCLWLLSSLVTIWIHLGSWLTGAEEKWNRCYLKILARREALYHRLCCCCCF